MTNAEWILSFAQMQKIISNIGDMSLGWDLLILRFKWRNHFFSSSFIQPGDASCHVLSSKDGSLVDLNYDEELNVHELVLSIEWPFSVGVVLSILPMWDIWRYPDIRLQIWNILLDPILRLIPSNLHHIFYSTGEKES